MQAPLHSRHDQTLTEEILHLFLDEIPKSSNIILFVTRIHPVDWQIKGAVGGVAFYSFFCLFPFK